MCVGVFRAVNTDDDFDTETGEDSRPFRGFPNTRVRLKGSPICDPRDPTQSYDDDSTWKYTTNSALIDAQHLYGWRLQDQLIVGLGVPEELLNVPRVIINANYCDVEDFTCHGVLSSGNTSDGDNIRNTYNGCLLYTSPSPRDRQKSRMPSSA